MIKLVNISKYYHNEGIVALGLRKINLEFKIGEFVAITGESGSGKSTLLNVISGIDTYEEGELYINGEETSHYNDDDWESYRQNRVAFIFQNYNLIDSYTVLKNVEVALVIQGMNLKERRSRAREIIARVGLEGHIHHRASKLSGGEKQRLAIARALAKDTDIIVADEPTGNLDSESGKQVLQLLHDVAKDKVVLVVSHNIEQITPYASRKIRLFDGEIVEDTQIRPAEYLQHTVKKKQQYPSALKSATIALYNFISQPKKTVFMLLVSLIIIAFIFFVYGSILSYRSNIAGEEDFYYGVYPERVIVRRKDGNTLTDTDYQVLKNNRLVENVVKEDLAISSQFSFAASFDHNKYLHFSGNVTFDQDFDDIIGRLPAANNEVLISTPFYDNDKNILSMRDETYYISFQVNYKDTYIDMRRDYKIVGIHQSVDSSSLVFSSEGFSELDLNLWIKVMDYYIIFEQDGATHKDRIEKFVIDERLQDNQVYYNFPRDIIDSERPYSLSIGDHELQWMEPQRGVVNYYLYLSDELFHTLFQEKQYTVNLKNGENTDKYIDYLYDRGYYGFSPYYDTLNSALQIIGAVTKAFSIGIMSFIIIIAYILSYLLFRSILNSKLQDYVILRIIGAEKKHIRQIIIAEILASFLFSYIIIFIVYQVIKIFLPILQDYRFIDYLILGLINILLALFVARKFINLQAKKSLFSSLRSEL